LNRTHTEELKSLNLNFSKQREEMLLNQKNEIEKIQDKHAFEMERKDLQKEKEFADREAKIKAAHQDDIQKQLTSYQNVYDKLEQINDIINELQNKIRQLENERI